MQSFSGCRIQDVELQVPFAMDFKYGHPQLGQDSRNF